MGRMAEQDIADALFSEMNISAVQLVSEKNYVDFGKKVAGVLYQGQAPYRIPSFFKEALKDV